MNVPFPPYEPDRSQHAQNATDHAVNVRPVADGWGPIRSIAAFSNALPSAPKGSIAVRTAKGFQIAFAGTSTGLYKLNSNGTWTDVSSGVYALTDGDEWSFDLFGERVIATNVVDGAFYYDVDSSTDFAALPGSPPKAKYVRVVGDFVWLLNLENAPSSYAWSGLNDSEQWASGVNFSDQGLFPDGGEIMGCVPITGGCFILQRNMIRQAVFAPSSGFTYTTAVVNERRGCASSLSIAVVGQGDFVFLSQDGFYRGAQCDPIGAERVDRTFKETVSPAEYGKVRATADPDEKLVYFSFTTTTGESSLLLYDWQLNRWSRADMAVSGFTTMVTASLTLEDLDALFPSGIDLAGITVDSTQFSGGLPAIAGFTADYRVGFFTGEVLAAEIDSATLELSPPVRAFVRGVQLIGDAAPSGEASFDDYDYVLDDLDFSGDTFAGPAFQCQAGISDYHTQTLTWGSSKSPHSRTGIVPFRSSGRLHRFRFLINANTEWTHLDGFRIDVIPEGNQ